MLVMWRLGRRVPLALGTPLQMRWLRLQDLSPFAKKELRFDTFPRHAGGATTLATIFGANFGVWMAWQVAEGHALAGDEALLDFMETHFVASNQGASELKNLHKIWLSSFSHQDWAHLAGNMTMLLILGPRLHEFLGRARFLFVYALGCLGGTMATQALHLDPTWEANQVRQTPMRYHNILRGNSPGQAMGLGASDAISALFAAFYLIFPRQPVPFLWAKTNLLWSLMPKTLQAGAPLISRGLRWTNAAAIWVLPSFFFVDFSEIARRLGSYKQGSGLLPESNTGHAAHVGGFLMGAGFYALVAHPIKAQYFSFTLYERFRRFYIMTLSLSIWYAITRLARRAEVEERAKKYNKSIFWLVDPLAPAGAGWCDGEEHQTLAKDQATQERLMQFCSETPELQGLLLKAMACSITESCRQSPMSGKCGDCDDIFWKLQAILWDKSAAPKLILEALSPQMLDATMVCRHVLRTIDREDLVHKDYLDLTPQIRSTLVSCGDSFSLRNHLLGLSHSIKSMRHVGLILSETKKGCLVLTRVDQGSRADKAGAAAFVGHNLTHIAGKRVHNIEEAEAAIRGCREAKLWFEHTPLGRAKLDAQDGGRSMNKAAAFSEDLPLSACSTLEMAFAQISPRP